MTRTAAAIGYRMDRGWHSIPCCWPMDGRCGCGRSHQGRAVGKAPLLGAGYQHLRPDAAQVGAWWCRWPRANVGILLEPAGLAVIDLDGPGAQAEATALGLPATYTVRRGDHAHLYYRRPAGVPAARTTHRGACRAIDVLAAGYVIAPPSRHASGDRYTVTADLPLADLPAWAARWLREGAARPAPTTGPVRTGPPREVRLSPRLCELLESGAPEGRRSEAVAALEVALIGAGHDDATILTVLLERPWVAGMADTRGRMNRWLAADLARLRGKGAAPRSRPWSWAG